MFTRKTWKFINIEKLLLLEDLGVIRKVRAI